MKNKSFDKKNPRRYGFLATLLPHFNIIYYINIKQVFASVNLLITIFKLENDQGMDQTTFSLTRHFYISISIKKKKSLLITEFLLFF